MSEADFAISEHERIRVALEHIPPDVDRETWRRIAAALKTELGDAGFDLFCLWSANGDKYHAAAARDTWRSQTPGRITIGTLFEIAKRYGFDTRSNRPAPLPPAARAQRKAQRQERKTSELATRDTKLKHAAMVALAVWNKATPARDDHPYLTHKGVRAVEALREIDATKLAALANYTPKSNGEPLQGRVLVAPVEIDGRLSTLEMIDEAGRKSALAGGAKAGGCWSAVPIPARVSEIVIAEGVATALSIYECTGAATVAALSCSNIHKVTDAMRAQHPAAAIVVAGDVGNGEANARKAVLAAGVKLALPDFGVDRHDDQTDFNDLHQANGADAVRAAIDAAAVPDAPVADTPRYPALNERPCWRLYEAPVKCGGDVLKPGVYWHRVKYGKGTAPAVLTDQWICTPLRVLAVTRNREDAEYGRLLEIRSPSGHWKKWAMPMAMLAGDGSEARAVLLGAGLTFDYLHNRNGVLQYIASQTPERTMRAATATGWHDGAFVLPARVIGADDIWFQTMGRVAPYACAGTTDGWRKLASLANGNPLLMLGIMTAFAGPLLKPLEMSGAALHLFGDSSIGKTTALRGGASAWGGGQFPRTWRATANGLEGAGLIHTDTLLPLDEIGEIDPRQLYEVAYALVNGTGKSRANRYGEARQAARWRVFVLSTGETTLTARMSAGGITAKAGQEMRFLDVPCEATWGLFDTLHGRTSGGALSDEIRELAGRHYGHAGPLFVESLARELATGLELSALLRPVLEKFGALDGQHRRAAQTFAVCALAGELAIRWGVVPWTAGEPTEAAVRAFNLWRGRRQDSAQGSEHAAILRAVADYIERHGDSRFSDIEVSGEMIRDRAGYWKHDGESRLYLFTAGGLREATKGFDFSRVKAALDQAGALAKETGRLTKTTRKPDGTLAKLYHVSPDALPSGE